MLKGVTEAKTKDIEEKLIGALKEISVTVEVILGQGKISLERFLELKSGDVIVLNKHLREPLEVRVQNIPKMLGFLGQVGNRKAVKIYKIGEEEKDG